MHEPKEWTDEELKALEDSLDDPDEWDWDNAVIVHPTERPGSIVSVRFSPADFQTVGGCAERMGKKLTDFIREAALAYAAQHVEANPAERPVRGKKIPHG